MIRRIYPVICFCFIIALALCIGVFSTANPAANASAIAYTVTQTKELRYNNANFVTSGKIVSDEFFDSVEIKRDGVKISIDASQIEVYEQVAGTTDNPVIYGELSALKSPKIYSLRFVFIHDGLVRTVDFNFALSKAVLRVTTLVNGTTSPDPIFEGTDYEVAITYAVIGLDGGIIRNSFYENDIMSAFKAFPVVAKREKLPAERMIVGARGAESDKYAIEYVDSILTIMENPLPSVVAKTGDSIKIMLEGALSPLGELNFFNIGINKTEAAYAIIIEKSERLYTSRGLFNGYRAADCFRAVYTVDNENVENLSTKIYYRLDGKLAEKTDIRVVALYNNGQDEIIVPQISNGFIVFDAADLGDFLILEKYEGLPPSTIAAVVAGVVGGLVLIFVLAMVFKKKY